MAAGVAALTTEAGMGSARGGDIPTLTLIIIPTPLTRMPIPSLRCIAHRRHLPTGTTAKIPKVITRTSKAARVDG